MIPRSDEDDDEIEAGLSHPFRTSRNRKSHSCTECRRRKKHCDRRIPGCNQCKLRGTIDQCKWGDERDEVMPSSRQSILIDDHHHQRNSASHNARFSPYHRNDQNSAQATPALDSSHTSRAREAFQRITHIHLHDERAALMAELADADNNLGTRNEDSSMEIQEIRHSREPQSSSAITPRWDQSHYTSLDEVQQLDRLDSRSPPTTAESHHVAQPILTQSLHHRVGPSSRSSRSTFLETQFPIRITIEQARDLFHLHRYHELFPDKMLFIDNDKIAEALEEQITKGAKDLSQLRHEKTDIFALLMMVCASTMCLLPPTYCITMGIRTRYDQVDVCIDEMHKAAEEAIDSLPAPTLTIVQAGNLYLHNLTQRCSARDHIQRLDQYIRSARRLGLDRLGSPEDDERIWSEMDNCQQHSKSVASSSSSSTPSWAAYTLQTRNRRERNLGRVHWRFLTGKDWVASRLSGSYQIYPSSYTTSLPRPYKEPSNDYTTPELTAIWEYFWIGAESSREYADLTADAESKGNQIDYGEILRMDERLKSALDTRPKELRSEDLTNMKRSNKVQQYYALLISCTLWHRLFIIHRPFLMLSQLEPEKYKLSASRSWYYARLTIRTIREVSQSSLASIKQVPMHFRLLQASLVIISHLFLWPHSPSLREMVDIHEDLHFSIETLKGFEGSNDKSMFAGQGSRLEALLAAASRIKRSKKNTSVTTGYEGSPFAIPTEANSTNKDPLLSMFRFNGHKDQSNEISAMGQDVSDITQTQQTDTMALPSFFFDPENVIITNPAQFTAMDTLDDQLLRLMGDRCSVLPTSTDEIWTEIFKFLDSDALHSDTISLNS